MPPLVAAAGIAAGASIVGGIVQSGAARNASRSSERTALEALAEQRRIYDIEDAKEREKTKYEREQSAYDRKKTLHDEAVVRSSRQNAFGGFGNDLTTFSKGYAPVYGMGAEGTAALLEGRNASARRTSDAVPRSPMPPDMEDIQDPRDVLRPNMPRLDPNLPAGPRLPGPSGSMGSTVWLQSPDGQEEMEVPISEAQPMIQAGAILIPGPSRGIS